MLNQILVKLGASIVCLIEDDKKAVKRPPNATIRYMILKVFLNFIKIPSNSLQSMDRDATFVSDELQFQNYCIPSKLKLLTGEPQSITISM